MTGRVNSGAGQKELVVGRGLASDSVPGAVGMDPGSMLSRLGVEALSRLADLSRSDDEKVALAATQEILNRAFGKVPPPRAESAPESTPTIQIINYADWLEQRMEAEDA